MDSMRRVRLGDVALVEISGVDKKTTDGEKPVRLCNFTDVYKNWAITAPMYDSFMVASANDKEISRFSLRRGQVAITKDSETRDDIGIPTYIADNFDDVLLGYHCALITPDETKLDGKYLNAFLHTVFIQKFFSANASGSGQRYTLSVDTLNEIPIYLPSLEEQKRIGEVFSNIDRKIEINRQINDYLEAMARQLYDYWFVQFDFPDTMSRKPYKSSGGKMVWSEKLKKEIPEGWKDCTIRNICDIRSGFPFKSDSYTDTGVYRIVTIRNVQDHNLDLTSTERIDDLPDRLPDYCNLNIGDCLISLTGNVGRVCRVDTERLLLNQRVGLITDKTGYPEWVYSLFDDTAVVKQILLLANGCAQANVSPIDIGKILICLPDEATLDAYNSIITALRQLQMKCSSELTELSERRNDLLPMLMNGQVSVKPLNNHLSEYPKRDSNISARSWPRLLERLLELPPQSHLPQAVWLSHGLCFHIQT